MYEVTCFRAFDPKKIYGSTNRKAKGQFTLKFDTLEEIAKWFVLSHYVKLTPVVVCKTNLNRHEEYALNRKITSFRVKYKKKDVK